MVGGNLPVLPQLPGAPAIGPAQIQQALNDHDHIKRSTEILLYYGHKDKDTISACLLIYSVEKAANIAAWANNAWKINEFYMILQHDNIKAQFLKTLQA